MVADDSVANDRAADRWRPALGQLLQEAGDRLQGRTLIVIRRVWTFLDPENIFD